MLCVIDIDNIFLKKIRIQKFYKLKIHCFFLQIVIQISWGFFHKYFDLNETTISHEENISSLSDSDVS